MGSLASDRERDLSFMMEATQLLARSLDVETTLATVARLSLPHLGSWCIVDLREGEGMRRLAIVHPDPAKQALAEQLMEGWPPHRDDPLGIPSVMRTGRSQVVAPVTDRMLERAARSEGNLAILRALEIGSLMTIPMIARGEVLGAITYVSATDHRDFTALDLVLGEDLAGRAAIAIDNARLMRRSERALAAAELSELRLSRTIGIAAEAIISTDAGQRITLYNDGAAHIFGYTAEEAMGQPLTMLLPHRVREIHEAHVRAFGESPETARRMGHRAPISGLRRNGEEFPAEASISKLEIAGERIFTVVLRDITEARKAEAAQERLLDALTEATEARARLIRGVTHDVKNPLGAADGFAQLLEMELQSALSPEQAGLVAGIRRNIGDALAIVTDLLDVSQAESGMLSIHRAPLDLGHVAAEAVDDLRGAAEAAGHTLAFDETRSAPPHRDRVRSDPTRIRQVLGNLLTNAIKYTPPPGRITVWTESARSEDPERPGDWLAVHVADSGPGIPPAEREDVFQEYHRLQPRSGSKGHGLGLAISRRIARLLSGELSVSGEPGEGATFSLWLPVDSADARDDEAPAGGGGSGPG